MIVMDGESSFFGDIEVTPHGTEMLSSPIRPGKELEAKRDIYCWRPKGDARVYLPTGFSVGLVAYTAADGVRRFVHVDGYEGFVAKAFAAGFAILAHEQGWSAAERSGCLAQWLFYRKVRGMKEHLDRSFSRLVDLYIRPSGREQAENHAVLPEFVGLDAQGRGEHWNQYRLCKEGKRWACDDGATVTTDDEAIWHGLRAAAESNPLQLDDDRDDRDDRELRMMGHALFERGAVTEPDCEYVDHVYARTIDYFARHADDPHEKFSRSYFGPHGNLFKTLAGRQISINEARAAFLKIGWDAYTFVAQCIGRFVEEFQDALPMPLSPPEQDLFSQTYAPQPYLGGLSLMQVMERGKCLAPVIHDVWSSPGDLRTIGVLHRVFWTYAEMVEARHIADRRIKQWNGRLEVAHSGLAESKAIDYSEVPNAKQGGGYATVARILREIARRHEEKCGVCDRLLDAELFRRENVTEHDRDNEIDFVCPDHEWQCRKTIPIEEFRDAATAIDWKKEHEIEPLDWPLKWLTSVRCLAESSN